MKNSNMHIYKYQYMNTCILEISIQAVYIYTHTYISNDINIILIFQINNWLDMNRRNHLFSVISATLVDIYSQTMLPTMDILL